MSIYLGEAGHVELQRRSTNEGHLFTLEQSDVDLYSRRFSFEGLDDKTFLITGDRVHFERTDGKDLQLLDGVTGLKGVSKFVHIDTVGGLRLYDTFSDAVNGTKTASLKLVQPTEDQEITVDISDLEWRCLAHTQSYSLTTARETIDLTNLGDEFRRSYSNGLINGQGQCTCLWNYEGTDSEFAQYLAKLVLRLQLGAMFKGKFFLKKGEARPADSECGLGNPIESVWWEAHCIVTNVSMALSPGQVIQTTIEFVTSDAFTLKAGVLPGALEQDSPDPTADFYILEEETGAEIFLDEAI